MTGNPITPASEEEILNRTSNKEFAFDKCVIQNVGKCLRKVPFNERRVSRDPLHFNTAFCSGIGRNVPIVGRRWLSRKDEIALFHSKMKLHDVKIYHSKIWSKWLILIHNLHKTLCTFYVYNYYCTFKSKMTSRKSPRPPGQIQRQVSHTGLKSDPTKSGKVHARLENIKRLLGAQQGKRDPVVSAQLRQRAA